MMMTHERWGGNSPAGKGGGEVAGAADGRGNAEVVVRLRLIRRGLNGAVIAAEIREFKGTMDEVEAALQEELEHWDSFQVLKAEVRE